MKQSFDIATVNRILDIDEPFKAPSRLMEIIFDRELREKTFKEFLSLNSDLSYDWFQGYFEEEQADRKAKKQDFTPTSVTEILNKLTDTGNTRMDVAAGTGGITINRWWQDIQDNTMATYRPSKYLYQCEELSDRAVPFLLFNLVIRGVNAIVIHGDSLERTARGVFFIQNSDDDFMHFSDVNVMPYSDQVMNEFEITWKGERYPEHLESPWNDEIERTYKEVVDQWNHR